MDKRLIALALALAVLAANLKPLTTVQVPGPEGLDANIVKVEHYCQPPEDAPAPPGTTPSIPPPHWETIIIGDPSSDDSNYCMKLSHGTGKLVVLDMRNPWVSSGPDCCPGDVEIQVTRAVVGGTPEPPSIGLISWDMVPRTSRDPGYPLVDQAEADQVIVWNHTTVLPDGTLKVEAKKARVTYADFYVLFRLVPRTGDDAARDIRVWIMLSSVNWEQLLGPAPEEGLAYKRGAVIPIMAFVKEAYTWVWVDDSGRVTTDPPTDYAESYVEVLPGNPGAELSLYTQPDTHYEYYNTISPNDYISEAYLEGWSPDYRTPDTVYLSFYIEHLDSVDEKHGWGRGETEYYPAVLYKVRVIVLVAGEYTFLWDKDTARRYGWWFQPESSEKSRDHTPLDTFFDMVTSPKFLALASIALGVIILVVLAQSGALGILAIGLARKR